MPSDLSSYLILIVDDSEDDRQFVRDALHGIAPGLRLAEAHDGVEALAYIRNPANAMPDLVLLDLKMPRKDGLETLADIRDDLTLRHLPVVAVFTTATDPEFVRRAYAAGANAYIGKPSSMEGLRHIMDGVIRHWFEIATLPPHPNGRARPAGGADDPPRDPGMAGD
jgi:CheY-like chemotaxis protein